MTNSVDLSTLAPGDAIVFEGQRLIAVVMECRLVGWMYSINFVAVDDGGDPVKSATLFHKSGKPAISILCPAIVQVIKAGGA